MKVEPRHANYLSIAGICEFLLPGEMTFAHIPHNTIVLDLNLPLRITISGISGDFKWTTDRNNIMILHMENGKDVLVYTLKFDGDVVEVMDEYDIVKKDAKFESISDRVFHIYRASITHKKRDVVDEEIDITEYM